MYGCVFVDGRVCVGSKEYVFSHCDYDEFPQHTHTHTLLMTSHSDQTRPPTEFTHTHTQFESPLFFTSSRPDQTEDVK